MPLAVTEDTPPDMLAGAMDIKVVLPGGRTVNMSVERSTPMMDLLVQLTTTHKLSLASHMTVALSESGARLHHLPSTPIGALDTRLLHVAPRNNTTLKRAPLRPNNAQPFQTTFRLQVHLPRNQLFVTRVSPDTCLADILRQACAEKNLDPAKYELRHPANLQEKLSLSHTLGDYHLQEVTLVAARPMGSPLTPADIMALQKEEEKRRQQVKASGSAYIVYNKRSSTSVLPGTGSVSSDSLNGRSISPARSDESANRSISPPAPLPPQRPGRKRRPAPKPPAAIARNETSTKDESLTSHSRTSSDSSGYHEASVLSESNETRTTGDVSADTLPRRSKLPPSNAMGVKQKSTTLQNGTGGNANHINLSRSLSNLTAQIGISGLHSVSTTSLASQGHPRKKKAAPPPPVAPARKQAQPAPPVPAPSIPASSIPAPSVPTPAITSVQVPTTPSTTNTVKTTLVKVNSAEGTAVVTVVEKPRPPPVQEEVKPITKEVTVKEAPKPVQEVSKPAQIEIKSVDVKHDNPPNSRIIEVKRVETPTEQKPAVASPVPVAKASITPVPSSPPADLTKPVPKPRPRLLGKPLPLAQPRKAVAPSIPTRSQPNIVDTKEQSSNEPRDQVEEKVIQRIFNVEKDVIQQDNADVDYEYLSVADIQAARKSSGYGSVEQAFTGEEFDVKDNELPQQTSTSGANRFSDLDLETSSHCDESLQGANDVETSSTDSKPLETPVKPQPRAPLVKKANSDAVMSNVSSYTSLRSLDEKATLRMGESNLTRWSNENSLDRSRAWRLGSQDTESESERDFGRDRCASSELESSEWEYQLPDPPSAFRDLESPTLTEFGTVALADTPVFREPPMEQCKPSVERATVGSKSSRANDFEDSWEPQKLGVEEKAQPRPKFINGDLRLREDGVTKEVFKVNPIFNAQHYEEENVTKTTPAKYAPAESEIIEKSKKLVNRSISNNDLQSSNQLQNFTISAYDKPQKINTTSTSRNSTDDFKQPLPPKPAVITRTNSYTSTDVSRPPPVTVKRSTSYIALARPYSRPSSFQSINRTKSISSLVEEDLLNGELRKSNSEVNVSRVAMEEEPMLASLKVLKSILSQSQTALNSETEDSSDKRDEEDKQRTEVNGVISHTAESDVYKQPLQSLAVKNATTTSEDVPDLAADKPSDIIHEPETPLKEPVKEEQLTPEPKPFVYLGPPAINFGSWSERPKVQVSIKSDRDYRFGGQVSAMQQTQNIANSNSPVNRYKNAVARNSLPSDYTIVEAKPAKIEPAKIEPTPLTMRIVSHTTTSRSEISQEPVTSRSVESRQMEPKVKPETDDVDNSRLPIVRSVELKKTVPDNFVQLRNKSSTHLNGGSSNVAQVSINNYQSNINNRHSCDVSLLPSHLLTRNVPSSQFYAEAPSTNKKYTSVVGINGGGVNTLPRPAVNAKPDMITKSNVFAAPKPMPIVKGFRMSGNEGATFAPLREEQPTKPTPLVESKPVTYANNKPTEEKSNTFRGQPLKTINGAENARTQPTWAQRNEKFTEAATVIKFKKPTQRPLEKKFTNPRDALMDAIKNFGGEDGLKGKNEPSNGSG